MSLRVGDVLGGKTPPGVYRFLSRAKPRTISELAEDAGWRCFYLDGTTLDSKSALLDALATAANFPEYCGHNWDALEECLRDLSWAPASGYLILWDDANVLARADPRAFATTLQILDFVAHYWESQGVPFVVLVRRAGHAKLTT